MVPRLVPVGWTLDFLLYFIDAPGKEPFGVASSYYYNADFGCSDLILFEL